MCMFLKKMDRSTLVLCYLLVSSFPLMALSLNATCITNFVELSFSKTIVHCPRGCLAESDRCNVVCGCLYHSAGSICLAAIHQGYLTGKNGSVCGLHKYDSGGLVQVNEVSIGAVSSQPEGCPVSGKLYSLTDDLPTDCLDAKNKGFTTSGVLYFNSPFKYLGYCDMDTGTGGWLVFQKRFNGSVDFYRGWNEYEKGFGSLDGEFWLGLQLIHNITSSGNYELRVDLQNYDTSSNYATYSQFSIGSSETLYQLSVSGYTGNAGDALASHNSWGFSTFDQDHDAAMDANCAIVYHGAWWYQHCHLSNLNGKYSPTEILNPDAEVFNRWYGPPENLASSRKASEIKLRRTV